MITASLRAGFLLLMIRKVSDFEVGNFKILEVFDL